MSIMAIWSTNLTKLKYSKEKKTQITKIRNQREPTLDLREIKVVLTKQCKQLYANKLGNSDEWG